MIILGLPLDTRILLIIIILTLQDLKRLVVQHLWMDGILVRSAMENPPHWRVICRITPRAGSWMRITMLPFLTLPGKQASTCKGEAWHLPTDQALSN